MRQIVSGGARSINAITRGMQSLCGGHAVLSALSECLSLNRVAPAFAFNCLLPKL